METEAGDSNQSPDTITALAGDSNQARILSLPRRVMMMILAMAMMKLTMNMIVFTMVVMAVKFIIVMMMAMAMDDGMMKILRLTRIIYGMIIIMLMLGMCYSSVIQILRLLMMAMTINIYQIRRNIIMCVNDSIKIARKRCKQ